MEKEMEEVRQEFQKWADECLWRDDENATAFMGIGNVVDWWLERCIPRKILIKKLKEMPSRCPKCEKQGVNPYGECACSYEDRQYIKKGDVLALIEYKH